jgi:hypothetical protein
MPRFMGVMMKLSYSVEDEVSPLWLDVSPAFAGDLGWSAAFRDVASVVYGVRAPETNRARKPQTI